MRLSLLPGLLENVVFNRAYGTRDGALFEVGRTYHRTADGVREHARVGLVMYGTVGDASGATQARRSTSSTSRASSSRSRRSCT